MKFANMNTNQLDTNAGYNKEFNRTFESLKKPKKIKAMQNKQNEDIDLLYVDKSCKSPRSPDDKFSLHKLKQISKIDISQHMPTPLPSNPRATDSASNETASFINPLKQHPKLYQLQKQASNLSGLTPTSMTHTRNLPQGLYPGQIHQTLDSHLNRIAEEKHQASRDLLHSTEHLQQNSLSLLNSQQT